MGVFLFPDHRLILPYKYLNLFVQHAIIIEAKAGVGSKVYQRFFQSLQALMKGLVLLC